MPPPAMPRCCREELRKHAYVVGVNMKSARRGRTSARVVRAVQHLAAPAPVPPPHGQRPSHAAASCGPVARPVSTFLILYLDVEKE
eukprot:30009-Prymnesium_polylepis.1